MNESTPYRWFRTGQQKEGTFTPAQVFLVMVEVQAEPLEEAAGLISQVVDKIIVGGGTVFHIISTIVIATFEFGEEDRASAQVRCKKAAEALHLLLNARVKVLFGSAEAVYGQFGTATRMHYGPFFRQIGVLFEKLRDADFGELVSL